jgi:hypothetical protein
MQKVEAYFNLHKRKFSVRDARTRRVLYHADSVTLVGVSFKVSQAGRARVIREQRKNVHAYVQGYVISSDIDATKATHKRVTYNPYAHSTFIEVKGGAEIHSAPIARLTLEENRARIYV